MFNLIVVNVAEPAGVLYALLGKRGLVAAAYYKTHTTVSLIHFLKKRKLNNTILAVDYDAVIHSESVQEHCLTNKIVLFVAK